jgi:hypothetical protein
MAKENCLDERTRAEDIILGSLGFGEEATIISIEASNDGFRGQGRWSDGQTFEFASEEELSELESWAIRILASKAKAA